MRSTTVNSRPVFPSAWILSCVVSVQVRVSSVRVISSRSGALADDSSAHVHLRPLCHWEGHSFLSAAGRTRSGPALTFEVGGSLDLPRLPTAIILILRPDWNAEEFPLPSSWRLQLQGSCCFPVIRLLGRSFPGELIRSGLVTPSSSPPPLHHWLDPLLDKPTIRILLLSSLADLQRTAALFTALVVILCLFCCLSSRSWRQPLGCGGSVFECQK